MGTLGKVFIGIGAVIQFIAMIVIIAVGGPLGFVLVLIELAIIGLIVLFTKHDISKFAMGVLVYGIVVLLLFMFRGQIAINGVLYFVGGLLLYLDNNR